MYPIYQPIERLWVSALTALPGFARCNARAGTIGALITLASVAYASASKAQSPLPLNLQDAVQMAVNSEPGVDAIRARAEALRQESVAAGQLPDPQLRVGVGNFPIESGGFTTEGMTQAQLGLRQAMPPGNSRQLSTRRLASMANKMTESALARERDVIMTVRQAWLEAFYWGRAHAVVTETRVYFEDLVTVTRSLYAVGQSDQQDVLQADLALSRLDDRLIKIDRERARSRAALSEWIGEDARRQLASTLPAWPALPNYDALSEALATHPALRAAAAAVRAHETGIHLAKEQYKPGWAVDLGYGYRDGSLITGEPRSDFVSLSFTVDLPLFRADRQDRKLAAALSEREAAAYDQERLMRRLQSQLESEYARWNDLSRRIDLYQRSILPQANDRSKAALLAYQSQSSDFADVIGGYVDALETQLVFEKLCVERAQSHALIANLGGLLL